MYGYTWPHSIFLRPAAQWPELQLAPTGEIVELKGWEAFDAAVHCASCCAGERASPAIASQPPQPRTPERSLEPERSLFSPDLPIFLTIVNAALSG